MKNNINIQFKVHFCSMKKNIYIVSEENYKNCTTIKDMELKRSKRFEVTAQEKKRLHGNSIITYKILKGINNVDKN